MAISWGVVKFGLIFGGHYKVISTTPKIITGKYILGKLTN
jgi:hypothetical protein